MAELIIRFCLAIGEDQKVKITRERVEVQPVDGRSGLDVARKIVATLDASANGPGKVDMSESEPPPAVELGKHDQAEQLRNMLAPAATLEACALAKKIAAKGWLDLAGAESLVAHCGVARVRDVTNWVARKINNGEPVPHPGQLIRRVALTPQSQQR